MRTRPLAVLGLAAVLLTACGGSSGNGEAAKKGPQVAKDAAAALDKAGSVHVSGTVTSGNQDARLDLDLERNGGKGSAEMNGQHIDLVSAGSKVYVRATAPFWTAQGVPAQVVTSLADKWVIVPSSAGTSFGPLSVASLTDELRNPSDGKIKDAVHTATHSGKKVVVVSQGAGNTLEVAAEGTAYPLRIADKSSSDSSTFTLDGFGKKFHVAAPSGALDLSQLGSGTA